MTFKPLPPETIARIRQLKAAGNFYEREIAEMCGVGYRSVCKYARGIRNSRSFNRVTDEERKRIRELYATKELPEIAEIVGRSYKICWRETRDIRRKRKVPPRQGMDPAPFKILFEHRVPHQVIAERLGCSRTTVSKMRVRLGIPKGHYRPGPAYYGG